MCVMHLEFQSRFASAASSGECDMRSICDEDQVVYMIAITSLGGNLQTGLSNDIIQ